MDLLPQLDPSSPTPLYQQLYACFERQISSGELTTGERLPATRELAGLLGVNRTTVSAAYELLEQKGLIAGHVGRGSFVAGRTAPESPDWANLLNRPARQFAVNPAAISFAASRPPEELFPVADFQRSCEEVLGSGHLDSILQLGSPGGYEPLRNYLLEQARLEGVLATDDDLLITSGCQQALDLLRRVLVRPGARVAVEDPVYPGLKNILLEGGARLVNYQSDLARIAVLTPTFRNPTGLTMPLAEREMVLRAARDNATVLIENDIYSGLRYVGNPLPPLKQMAKQMASPANIALVRSFSKIAFPGLRLGWVIGPRPLITALRETKQLADLHSDQFSQAVMLRFAESGRLATHQAKTIEAGGERLASALDAAARFLPKGSMWTRPEGGLNFWITLPEGLDAAQLLERALREGVSYLPGEVFRVDRPQHSSLRISFGGVAPLQITRGIEILGRVFCTESESQKRAEREPAAAWV